jgi:heme exporter protein CcmD
MDHAPFIWSAYGITALILLWAAVSPLIRQSRAMRDIRLLQQLKTRSGESHDPNT